MDLPELALSVRQPWAWAIIHGGKDIENRSWQAVNYGLRQRGRIAIHAAKGMSRDEYEDARDYINRNGAKCPEAHALDRGGIIGSVEVVDVVNESDSPWFFGPRGIVLRNPQASKFVPAVGQLGYFRWTRADASIVPAPAAWMRDGHRVEVVQKMDRTADRFVARLRLELRKRGVDGAGVASITVKNNKAKLNWLWQGKACFLSLDKIYDRYMDGLDVERELCDALDHAFVAV